MEEDKQVEKVENTGKVKQLDKLLETDIDYKTLDELNKVFIQYYTTVNKSKEDITEKLAEFSTKLLHNEYTMYQQLIFINLKLKIENTLRKLKIKNKRDKIVYHKTKKLARYERQANKQINKADLKIEKHGYYYGVKFFYTIKHDAFNIAKKVFKSPLTFGKWAYKKLPRNKKIDIQSEELIESSEITVINSTKDNTNDNKE